MNIDTTKTVKKNYSNDDNDKIVNTPVPDKNYATDDIHQHRFGKSIIMQIDGCDSIVSDNLDDISDDSSTCTKFDTDDEIDPEPIPVILTP